MDKRDQILVATRGASRSNQVLMLANHLCRLLDANLTLLTVCRSEQDRSTGEASLRESMRVLEELLPPAILSTRLRIGHPAEEILDELHETPYQLVVLGDREQQTRLSRLVLGSTVERVIEHAPCAVAVAKGRVSSIRRILLCESGVAEFPLSELLIKQLPALVGAADMVRLLHVRSQVSAGPAAKVTDVVDEEIGSGKADIPESGIIASELKRLQQERAPATVVVRHGLVVDEVVSETKDSNIDLVIIGAHRGEGWQRVLLGDLAREIFRRVHVPILIVRPAGSSDHVHCQNET